MLVGIYFVIKLFIERTHKQAALLDKSVCFACFRA